ncbi:MAG TPA: DnaJ domain-containing protein [Candidatus Limnocylindria bacterium]|nr:DnaJ domain-containing protein [Candidatus Limnocylindria bacterium]
MHRETDPYRILQIDPRAESFVLEAAFRALARQYHPDGRAPDLERMAAINRAYAMVRMPADRKRYDSERLKPVGPGPPLVPPTTFDPWARRETAPADPQPAGSSILDFGRYSGWRLADLVRQDPDYLRWLARHSSGFRYRGEILELLPTDGAHRRAKATR